jgi:hypothetical protein
VEGERTALELEAGVRADMLKWVDALSKLLMVVKTAPHML